MFFKVEQSLDNTNALCAWDKEGTRLNYGECPTDIDKEQLKIIELHISEIYKK